MGWGNSREPSLLGKITQTLGEHMYILIGEKNTPSRYSIEIKIAFFYHAVHSKGVMDVREKNHF